MSPIESFTLDHFFSNALIILTFILYLDHAYKLATVLMALLAVFVIVEYNNDVNIIPFFVGFVCACAVVMFFYEKVVVKNSSSRFNYRNAYFLSFFVTQIIAVGFFVWDEDPYAQLLALVCIYIIGLCTRTCVFSGLRI